MNDTPEPLAAILEEQATDQHIIPFMGDDLAAALTEAGGIYISINGMCAALGLSPRGQMQRIQRTEELAQGLRRIPLDTKGGLQMTSCLRLDKVGLWLAGIETTRVKGEYRSKIVAYHRDLAPIAMRVFMRVMGVPGAPPVTTDPRLMALAEQYDALIEVALFMREHMRDLAAMPEQLDALGLQLDQAVALLENLVQHQNVTDRTVQKLDERTRGLSQPHRRAIQEMVSHVVEATKQSIGALNYATIYGRIKHRFRVSSYEAVPDEQFEALMQFLRDMLIRITGQEEPSQGNLF